MQEMLKAAKAAKFEVSKLTTEEKNAALTAMAKALTDRQEEILAESGESLREQVIDICLGYVRFLMDKPIYRSILMLKDEEFDNLYHKKRTQFGSLSQTLNAQLFAASGYTKEVWERKLMMVRSLIFGVVFLFDAGEFEYNETSMEYLRYTLNREFEIL